MLTGIAEHWQHRGFGKRTMSIGSPLPHPRAALPAAALAGAVLTIIAALALYGPIAQPDNYHAFADTRTWLGLPFAADLLSNLAFLVVGILGVRVAIGLSPTLPARAAWLAFFAGVVVTAFGSAYYHWAPDDAGLAIDRLPIAWACAWLTCALLAERLDPRFGHPAALVVGFVLASISVLLWYRGALTGTGDLRAYLFVQFLPVLLIPLTLALLRGGFLTAGDWLGAIALYLVAKGFELHDADVLTATGMVSGHTMKHLLAAGAGLWLAWRLAVRRRLT